MQSLCSLSAALHHSSGICARMASRLAMSAARLRAPQNGLNSRSLAYSCKAPRRTLAFLSTRRASPCSPTRWKLAFGSARASQSPESVASERVRTNEEVSCSLSKMVGRIAAATSSTSDGNGEIIVETAICNWPKAETAPQRSVYASEQRTSCRSSMLARSISGAFVARLMRKAATFFGAAASTPISAGESAVTSRTTLATRRAAWCSSSI
eukprot:scaffold16687_cov32-Tisochrysis_lutea.AAC.2